MDKEHILAEIRRTAEANGGKPLGSARFSGETGITESDWCGKYWVRWGDALGEAGFSPNVLTPALSDEHLSENLALLIRELGHYPVLREMKLHRRKDHTFPSHSTYQNRGTKSELVRMVREFCETHEGYEDILEIIAPLVTEEAEPTASTEKAPVVGHVYLIKSGKFYKIGYSAAVGRREYELALQLPEKPTTVHTIETDDPAGIEAYWHRRFADKRKNGEWFELDRADVAAFKRRKYM